jgi:DNA repair exonuclease SbcCD ATPase subunit
MSDMATEVIYARVPKDLKEAADAYASARGSTLTKAVVDLLDRGLSGSSDDRSVAELEQNLAQVRAEKAAAEAELSAAKTELSAVQSFAQRANRAVGSCPRCGKPITGYDLLGSGECPHCSQALASLIAPTGESSTLDQRELMFLVGALGAVLGIAYLASK